MKSTANSTYCTSTDDIEEQSRILRGEKEQTRADVQGERSLVGNSFFGGDARQKKEELPFPNCGRRVKGLLSEVATRASDAGALIIFYLRARLGAGGAAVRSRCDKVEVVGVCGERENLRIE
jgi:hypothetical protein